MASSNYVQLYHAKCTAVQIPTEDTAMYEDVDRIITRVHSMSTYLRDTYREALSSNRYCIAVPYEHWLIISGDRRFLPYKLDDGTEMYLMSARLDKYRSDIVDLMNNDYNPYDNEKVLIQSKLRLLTRYVDCKNEDGWNQYCRNYLDMLA